MGPIPPGRPGFRDWVDQQPNSAWPLLPLTHITRALRAEDIVRAGSIEPVNCPVFERPLAYFFYGRPAYRISAETVLKLEHACPFCFIFHEDLLGQADLIHAFDTGAFKKRLYSHVLSDDMQLEDYSLQGDVNRPNRLIAKVFASMSAYFDGDRTKLLVSREGTAAWEFHARAYIELLTSPGRNEPDDRICSIEVAMSEGVRLKGNLRAVIVPHTLWTDAGKAPWLEMLSDDGVQVAPYNFIPGRHPEHYHAMLEGSVKDLYRSWGLPL